MKIKGTPLVFNILCLIREKIITFCVILIYIPTHDLQLSKSCVFYEPNEILLQSEPLRTDVLNDLDLDNSTINELKQSSLEKEDATV